jgi:hypothetical protein
MAMRMTPITVQVGTRAVNAELTDTSVDMRMKFEKTAENERQFDHYPAACHIP